MKFEKLSPRQKEVLKLLAYGFSKEEIGKKLYISPKTVSTYLGEIYDYFYLSNSGTLSKPRALANAIYWQNNLEELKNLKIEELL